MLSLFVHPAARISSWKMWIWLFTTFSWGTSSPHSFNWPSYALHGRENCYSLVKSNQSQKCQISLLWSLRYFWAAKHFNKLQKGSHCAKKVLFSALLCKSKNEAIPPGELLPALCTSAPAHALYHLLKEEGKQGGDALQCNFLYHRFRSQLYFFPRASDKGEVNPAVAIIRRTRSQSVTNVPRGCKHKTGTFFRTISQKATWNTEQNKPISI